MNGQDIFYICLGISVIIIALATARAIPESLKLIERCVTHGKKPWPPDPPLGPPGDPWGKRK